MYRRHLASTLLATLLTPTHLVAQPPGVFEVCTDYNCDRLRPVQLDAQQWRAIQALFEPAIAPRQERTAIAGAIALLERYSGEQTGTWADRAANDGEPSDPGQLDCVAESLNSHRYLGLLAEHGLLRWHRVVARRSRNPWLFNYHWTAVIESNSGERYAVDSWPDANGQPPLVQPLQAWLEQRPASAR